MASKDEFKSFVKENPSLVKHINNGSMTWQKFYEMYDMYGSDNDVWKDYIGVKTVASATTFSLADTLGFLKNLDLDSVQNGISSIQRVVGMVSELTGKKDITPTKNEYKPRPLYKHFED